MFKCEKLTIRESTANEFDNQGAKKYMMFSVQLTSELYSLTSINLPISPSSMTSISTIFSTHCLCLIKSDIILRHQSTHFYIHSHQLHWLVFTEIYQTIFLHLSQLSSPQYQTNSSTLKTLISYLKTPHSWSRAQHIEAPWSPI